MHIYAVLYANYAEVYILHILHLYALSTLLMRDRVAKLRTQVINQVPVNLRFRFQDVRMIYDR